MKHGYYRRYVAYTSYINENDDFESLMEGVSSIYQDEQIQLRKYAYGCCEIVFNQVCE